jgi:outer membrane protein TolC
MKSLILFNIVWFLFLLPQSAFSSDNDAGIIHLTLEQAINRALVLNRGIQIELENLLDAQFSLTATRSDFQFKVQPHLFTNFSKDKGLGGGLVLSKKFPFGTTLSINPNVQKTSGEYESGLDIYLTQPLLKGLSGNYNLSAVKQSEYSVRTAERGLQLTRVGVILETVAALYDIIRKQKILELQESSNRRIQGYAAAAQIKQKKGYATALDVYRATIQLKQSQTMLTNSIEQYQDALDNLKIILNIQLEQDIEVTAPLTYEIVKIEETHALELALANREELKQTLDMIANLKIQAKAARHNTLPRLDLELKYSTKGTNRDLWESFNAGSGTVEVSLATGGDLARTTERMAYKRSLGALKNAEIVLSLHRDEIKRQVKNALRNLQRLGKNMKIQKEQIHEAQGKLELSKVKFAHGMADNFDLIESEAQYRQAEVDSISSIIDYIVGTYYLKSVTGILLEDYGLKKDNDQ